MLVGFAPAAPPTYGAIIGEKLSQRLGRSVIVENNAGASGRLAAEQVKRRRPTGWTVLVGNIGGRLAPVTFKNLSYDPLADFAQPVVRAADFQLAVAATKETGAGDVAGCACCTSSRTPTRPISPCRCRRASHI